MVRLVEWRCYLAMNSQQAHERAEASFRKKETQIPEDQRFQAGDDADRLALRAKTARLKALRLTRDAADITRVKSRPIVIAKKCSSDPP
jgi:hypothetical protein